MRKKGFVSDDGSFVPVKIAASALYAIETLVVILAGLALIVFGVILMLNSEAVSEILATMPEADAWLVMLDPILFIVAGVLVLLFGNLINFVVYKVILTLVGIAADVKIIRDRDE